MKTLNYQSLVEVINVLKIELSFKQQYALYHYDREAIVRLVEHINLLVSLANCFEDETGKATAPDTLFGAKVILTDQVPEGEIWLRKSDRVCKCICHVYPYSEETCKECSCRAKREGKL